VNPRRERLQSLGQLVRIVEAQDLGQAFFLGPSATAFWGFLYHDSPYVVSEILANLPKSG